MLRALEAGYRHIDTAEIYGNEEPIGRAVRDFGEGREGLFLTTKLWFGSLAYRRVFCAAERSLRRLKTDYVDLLLIHWPSRDVALEETLDAMMNLQSAGKVKLIGVSNFPPSWMKRASQYAPIACNQVEYHPFLSQEKVLAVARQLGIIVTAYSPLALGQVARHNGLSEIGRGHGKSAAQVALRWLVQQAGVATVPRAADPEHCRDNLCIFDFQLSSAEMNQVFGMAEGKRLLNPCFAMDWEDDPDTAA